MHLQKKLEYIQDLHNIIEQVLNKSNTRSSNNTKMKMPLENCLNSYFMVGRCMCMCTGDKRLFHK